MRGSFNNTLSARYGERSVSGPPGMIFAVDVPCRLVTQNEIDQLQFPFSLTHAWVTLDGVDLHPPTTTSPILGATYTDYLAADLVTIPSLTGTDFYVLREELVNPFGRPSYLRYLLLPLSDVVVPPWLPLSPPPPPGPGTLCSEAVPVALGGIMTGEVSTGEEWYAVDLPASGDYRLVASVVDPELRIALYYAPCVTGGWITQLSLWGTGGCYSQAYVGPSTVLLKVWSVVGVPSPYSFVMEAGSCP